MVIDFNVTSKLPNKNFEEVTYLGHCPALALWNAFPMYLDVYEIMPIQFEFHEQ